MKLQKAPAPIETMLFKVDRRKMREAIQRRLDSGRGPPIDEVGRGNLWRLMIGEPVVLTPEQREYVMKMIESVA